MTEEERFAIFEQAMHEASNVFGVDPAYFGEEGEEEVLKQIRKLGYTPDDILGKYK